MAKYAKTKKKTHHKKSRRMGALSLKASSPIVQYAPIVLGYFMADTINGPIDNLVKGKVDGKIVAAGEAGLGALLCFGKKKSVPKSIIGGVLLGAGIKRGLKEFGVITGFREVPVVGRRHRMNGYGEVPVIGSRAGYTGGYTPSTNLAGMGSYQVPAPVYKSVVGCCGSGSGVNADGRN